MPYYRDSTLYVYAFFLQNRKQHLCHSTLNASHHLATQTSMLCLFLYGPCFGNHHNEANKMRKCVLKARIGLNEKQDDMGFTYGMYIYVIYTFLYILMLTITCVMFVCALHLHYDLKLWQSTY